MCTSIRSVALDFGFLLDNKLALTSVLVYSMLRTILYLNPYSAWGYFGELQTRYLHTQASASILSTCMLASRQSRPSFTRRRASGCSASLRGWYWAG